MRESRRGIVDRIEGNLAVCEILSEREGESAVLREIPLEQFETQPREGDCFTWADGRARVDRAETQARKEQLEERFLRLKKKR